MTFDSFDRSDLGPDDLEASVALLSPYALSRKPKVIVIAGPTAVGKSRVSLEVAKVIGGEIISADSIQVYRGMDIGTSKVSPQESGNIVHHLVDNRDLCEDYDVIQFYDEVHSAIEEILSRGKVPIIVGGTGFYLHALLYGPPAGPPKNPALRDQLEKMVDEKGTFALYEQLRIADPEYARQITPHDRQKIIRAMEILHLTQKKVSEIVPQCQKRFSYQFLCWFLHAPREVLYSWINDRCMKMIEKGFMDEVRQLDQEGLRFNRSASHAIGYRQALTFLDSAQTPEDWKKFVEAFQAATRHYAKRQFTWFRKEPFFRWLDIHHYGLDRVVEFVLQDFETSDPF